MLPEHRRTAGAAPGRAVSAPFLRPSNSLDLSCLRGRMAPDVALGPVVQRLELAAHNGVVAGSNPAGPTIRLRRRPQPAIAGRRTSISQLTAAAAIRMKGTAAHSTADQPMASSSLPEDNEATATDRQSSVEGKRGSVRVDLGGR